ncbi:hypothetical protein [Mycoplasma nasistruthionis]|uniref:Asp23/Gls24 family envelope stress response protein n=1 Tax=Mycoplasma nasistruthionis TaxID=353852 RepID=A0A4Y6I802_9MOLU|nr:hypothetical protein [Mycoplasma nasistruthionis]QCZ36755.1 hypothetical protein FG904_01880 [Mycoplasma nasistruthionis]QDF65038.1 hypothetical protein FIV53_01865 [Mycoplasma nasistruthionis]
MELRDIQELTINNLSSIPGIIRLHNPVLDSDLSSCQYGECESDLNSLIDVQLTSKGYDIKVAVTLIEGVSAKFISTQLFKQLSLELSKRKVKINNLLVVIKGVQNE